MKQTVEMAIASFVYPEDGDTSPFLMIQSVEEDEDIRWGNDGGIIPDDPVFVVASLPEAFELPLDENLDAIWAMLDSEGRPCLQTALKGPEYNFANRMRMELAAAEDMSVYKPLPQSWVDITSRLKGENTMRDKSTDWFEDHDVAIGESGPVNETPTDRLRKYALVGDTPETAIPFVDWEQQKLERKALQDEAALKSLSKFECSHCNSRHTPERLDEAIQHQGREIFIPGNTVRCVECKSLSILKMPLYLVTCPCAKQSKGGNEYYVQRAYYARGVEEEHACIRAELMLPQNMDLDDQATGTLLQEPLPPVKWER